LGGQGQRYRGASYARRFATHRRHHVQRLRDEEQQINVAFPRNPMSTLQFFQYRGGASPKFWKWRGAAARERHQWLRLGGAPNFEDTAAAGTFIGWQWRVLQGVMREENDIFRSGAGVNMNRFCIFRKEVTFVMKLIAWCAVYGLSIGTSYVLMRGDTFKKPTFSGQLPAKAIFPLVADSGMKWTILTCLLCQRTDRCCLLISDYIIFV
jgi:hypothetical protein